MPPQQGERLLDLADDGLDFGFHGSLPPGALVRRERVTWRETGKQSRPGALPGKGLDPLEGQGYRMCSSASAFIPSAACIFPSPWGRGARGEGQQTW